MFFEYNEVEFFLEYKHTTLFDGLIGETKSKIITLLNSHHKRHLNILIFVIFTNFDIFISTESNKKLSNKLRTIKKTVF